MVRSFFHPNFKKTFSKIKDSGVKAKLVKLFIKLKDNPEIGMPMRYDRKGTKEVYIPPYRLSYAYLKDEEKIIFLDLYRKDD
jgi:mRNA-degrading endonuclease RelE of RelBE toxin-antitoxin system